MARLLQLAALALALCVASAEDNFATAKPEDSSDEEPAGYIAVRVFQPRVFGGIMIRGHCGQLLMARSIPIISRVVVREFPSKSGAESNTGGPWAHGDSEGAVRSMDSFFALSHPLALFREGPSELDKWHEARMRALELMQSRLDRLHEAFEEASDNSNRDQQAGSATASAESTAGNAVAEPQARELVEASAVANSQGAVDDPDAASINWNPTNICGAVLLGLASALLVAMLLLSLSTIIYGCSQEETDPVFEADNPVEAPLLKGADVPVEDAAPATNPLCKYEPPETGK